LKKERDRKDSSASALRASLRIAPAIGSPHREIRRTRDPDVERQAMTDLPPDDEKSDLGESKLVHR